MSHPYRMQLPVAAVSPGTDDAGLRFPEAVHNSINTNSNSNNVAKTRTRTIKPHQILAKQQLATNTRKSHPFLQQLPTDVSKSLESLHLNSPTNQTFDSSVRPARRSTTSDSVINNTNNNSTTANNTTTNNTTTNKTTVNNTNSNITRTTRASTLHSSKPINSIRSLLVDDSSSNYYPSDKTTSSYDDNANDSSNIIDTANLIPNSIYKRDEPLRPKNTYQLIPEYTNQYNDNSIPSSSDKTQKNEPQPQFQSRLDPSLRAEFNLQEPPQQPGTRLDPSPRREITLQDPPQPKSLIPEAKPKAADPRIVVERKEAKKPDNTDLYSNFTGVHVDSSADFTDSNVELDGVTIDEEVLQQAQEEEQPEQVDQSDQNGNDNFTIHKKTKSVLNLLHPVYNNIESSTDEINSSVTLEQKNPESTVNTTTQTSKVSNNNLTVNLLPLGTSIDMYRQNAKKTKDPDTIFTFAQILIRTALSKRSDNPLTDKEKESYLEEAFNALKKASKLGSIESQYYLGDAFSVGLFNKGKPDLNKSLTYFESAAKAKHAESAYRTAMCYKKGWGCTRDARKAIKYLEIASLNNHPVAMMEYGIYAFHGLMSFPDDMNTKKKGISWLRRATEIATELSCGAPYELALIYLNGFKDIVIKDTNYAIKLLFKASSLGHGKSASMLGKFYEIGDIVDQNADLSIHFYNMSANLGDVDGIMGLCSWYFVGSEHLPQDFDEAFAWAHRAAEGHKHIKAMLLLERFYELGVGCEKDPKKSKYWGDLARKLDDNNNNTKSDKKK